MSKKVKNVVAAADKEAQYDERAKRILGQKIILAHILVKTVGEFKGMNPKDVVSYIEGDPYISSVSVEPGVTNIRKQKNGSRVTGFNTENTEINEGLIRFDIILLPENSAAYELHRLLGTLLSKKLSVDEKLSIIRNEYDIIMKDDFREDVSEMCNLGRGVLEEGIEIGMQRGIEQGMERGLSAMITLLKGVPLAEVCERIRASEEAYQNISIQDIKPIYERVNAK